MSKLLTASTIALLLILMSFSLKAQTKERPNAVGFNVLFLDYFTPNSGPSAKLGDVSNGFALKYQRYLTNSLDVMVPVRFGIIDLPDELNIDNISFFGLDALLKLKYYKEKNLVTPYLFAGGGYVLEGSDGGHLQIPAGIGFDFAIWKRAAINIQASYRYSPTENKNALELGLGFVVTLGKVSKEEQDTDGDGVMDDKDKCPKQKGSMAARGCPDRDNDGVPDDKDRCPDEAGTVRGCPDSDGDGIADKNDDCPDEVGIKELDGCPKAADPDEDGDGVPDAIDDCPTESGTLATKGCPDGDGDGVPDKEDLCPDESGIAVLMGCPDGDGDGVADKNDNCPELKGLAQFNGCPDSDNDGVADPNDKCPDTAGSAENYGCPEINQEERDALALAVRSIQFETGKAVLKSSSYPVLDQIATILNRYPNYRASIAGHTDSIGNSDRNYTLSEERAKSCYNYLLSQGFDPNRMSFIGYGETQPISSNSTREGRRLNRRVEFNLYIE